MLGTHCCKLPSKYRPVTHVIFDLDGTILDTEGIYNDTIREIVEKYEKKLTVEMKQKVAGTQELDCAKIIVNDLKLPITTEEFLKQYKGISNAKISNCELMPGAEALIKHLHSNNIPIAIATSSSQGSFDLKARNHKELFALFHHIVCGASDPEVTQGKPSPDIFLLCASRFEERPEPSKCLVLEDAPHGVNAALSAGMQVVMIPNEEVPYEVWKSATLRLDTLELMAPEFFGLPPLVTSVVQGFAGFRGSPSGSNHTNGVSEAPKGSGSPNKDAS